MNSSSHESVFIAREILEQVINSVGPAPSYEHQPEPFDEDDDAFHPSNGGSSPEYFNQSSIPKSRFLFPGNGARDSGYSSSLFSSSSRGWSSRSSSESATSPVSVSSEASFCPSPCREWTLEDPAFLDTFRTRYGLVDLDRLYPCKPEEPCLLDKILMAEQSKAQRRAALWRKSMALNLKCGK